MSKNRSSIFYQDYPSADEQTRPRSIVRLSVIFDDPDLEAQQEADVEDCQDSAQEWALDDIEAEFLDISLIQEALEKTIQSLEEKQQENRKSYGDALQPPKEVQDQVVKDDIVDLTPDPKEPEQIQTDVIEDDHLDLEQILDEIMQVVQASSDPEVRQKVPKMIENVKKVIGENTLNKAPESPPAKPAAPPPPPPPLPPPSLLKSQPFKLQITSSGNKKSNQVDVELRVPKASLQVDLLSQLKKTLGKRQNRSSLRMKYKDLN